MTNYEQQVKQAHDDYEFIKTEYKQISDLRDDYIIPIQKQLEDTNISELSIGEYNQLVNEVNEYIEEYNSRAHALRELIEEQYKYKGAV
ncbi:TPA: hypothetical protein PSJ07_002656 [Staphylococcus aureus]|nr:hypothetical protein [Staphylococcus aureus]